MYDEGLVANVYDTADAIAGVEGCTGARIVFDCAVIVAVLDVLQAKSIGKLHKIIAIPAQNISCQSKCVLSIVAQHIIMRQKAITQRDCN